MVLGGIEGLEREIASKPAGMRMPQCMRGAACLLIAPGEATVASFAQGGRYGFLRADPIRIIEATITWISFLGAG